MRSRLDDTLRCALPLQAPLTCTSSLSCLLSLLGSLRMPLKTKFTPALSSVYSLFLSPPEHTREKKSCPLSTVDPSKSSQSRRSKFILSSLDFVFNTSKTNCALDEDSAGVTVVGSRTKLGVPALTGLLQQTSLNVGYQIQVSRAHTAGSG